MRRFPLALLALTTVAACGGERGSAAPTTPTPPPQPVSPPTDTVVARVVAPGVRHIRRWEVAGPWAVHVVEVDLAVCGVGLRTVKAGELLAGRETTSALAARLAAQQGRPVFAAVNADFFNAAGVPVGAQVSDGELVRGSTQRPIFGLSRNGAPFFGADVMGGFARTRRGLGFEMRWVNERPDTLRLALFNRFAGATTPFGEGLVEVAVRNVVRPTAVGDTLLAVVVQVDTLAAGIPVPQGGVVFVGAGRGASFLRTGMAVGDTVRWSMRFSGQPGPIAELVAGDPQFMRAGEAVPTPAWAVERHPRTAVGVSADRKLLLVTVDGRQPGYSVGMTLPELTSLFQRLGAVDALNLDGGGSTTAVVEGRVVNRPSEATGERTVANAVAVLGPAPGSCGR